MITVYRISTCHFINDLSGEGAFRNGGRWNRKGVRVLYTAENAALAMLEALAHITMLSLKQPFCMARISMPDDVQEVDTHLLPAGWNAQPPSDVAADLCTSFVAEAKHLALKLPSVLVPDNYNIILNPLHPLFAKVKVVAISNISFDQRSINTQ